MKKLTPKDVLTSTLQEGQFTLKEQERHAITEKMNKLFRTIDTKLFGEIFLKCMGDINSIVKRGIAESNIPQRVVKRRLGFRTCSDSGLKLPSGNAKYATTEQIFGVMHPEHIELTCKRAKREMLKDFYELKKRFVMKFQNMKVIAMEHVEDFITVSDGFDIGHKKPNRGTHSYETCGYMLMNARAVSKSDVFVTIEDHDKLFSSYAESVSRCTHSHYTKSKYNTLTFTVFIRELQHSTDDQSEPIYINVPLFECTVDSKAFRYSEIHFRCFNTSFDGIDVQGMAKALADEYDTFYDEFNEGLEAVKMKYHGEFLLNEICDAKDGAI